MSNFFPRMNSNANQQPTQSPSNNDVPASGGAPDYSFDVEQSVLDIEHSVMKDAAIERINTVLERENEVRRETRADIARITAPTARAGYLVAGIVGLLLFWFLTTVVFNGNKIATGVLIFATAFFFLGMLKKTLESKGARYIADTGGVAMGIV